MARLSGEQVLMRVFIGDADRHGDGPLYRALVEMLRAEGIAGATVLKGTMGFGAKNHLHADHLLSLSGDLPVVIEVVDTAERIDAVMPKIDAMVREGLVTLEKVRVLRYDPKGGD
ncbi:MAG: DUF190 domain-containing protein [Myxococcales bacterium]|nr:DUF190 domain-containing protein [Myxococcales bacterium]